MDRTAHAPYARPRHAALHAALAAALGAALCGCPAHVDPRRTTVRQVNFQGVRQVDADDIRERLAIRETPQFPANRPRWLRWWRWWWVEPEYLDESSLTRDRLRVRRFYQARGFYDADVAPPRLTLDGRRADVSFTVTEGQPTLVADIRLRGCEPGETLVLTQRACDRIRERMELRVGGRFDESSFSHDRQQVLDFTRDAGFATPTVVPRAVVDPERRLAWVEYTIRPGPRSRFGRVRLLIAPSEEPLQGDTLPNGLPAAPILSTMGIEPGDPYSRRALASAQQALFDLGVFGIARIEEVPRADGTVDLDVRLSPSRLWRFRVGLGADADNTRTNVHALFTYDHRNFLGGMRRLRLDLRPQIFLPAILSGGATDFAWAPGGSVGAEVQQPELSPHTTGIVNASFELGPDPVNPSVAYRQALRGGVGLEARPSREVRGTFFVRTTNVAYLDYEALAGAGACTSAACVNRDPILRQQFFDRNYVHFEQSISWDRRNNPAAPTGGSLFTLNLAEGTRSPLSDYTFLRAQLEGRGYVNLRRGLTLAFRGIFGAIVGSSVYDQAQARWYWPVPPELRFYSGGTQSNRGYPFNRVGLLGASQSAGNRATGMVNRNQAAQDDPNYIAIGGTAMWEGSVELRWQPGALGMVVFFDASNVTGIDPGPFLNPQGQNRSDTCAGTPGNAVADYASCTMERGPRAAAPPPQRLRDAVGSLLDFSSWDGFLQALHPSVGLGLRYATPVGSIRLDVGVRLADLACSLAARDVAAQNAAVASGYPAYYVLSTPRCDFLGFESVPATVHFSIGEAY